MRAVQGSRYKITVSQVAETAKMLAAHIHGFTAINKIDPDNLVILLGEFHGEMSHHYFERKFLQQMHRQGNVGGLWIEGCVRFQPELDVAQSQTEWQRLKSGIMKQSSIYRLADNHPIHYAIRKNIPVICTDAPQEWDVDEDDNDTLYLDDVLPDGFQDKYKKNKMLRELMRKNAQDLFSARYEHANDSDIGMLKRNLFMMDRMLEATAQYKGTGIALVGHKHIVNPDYPTQPTLAEMLYANGKDVINISLYPQRDITVTRYRYNYNAYMKKLARSSTLQQQRLREQRNQQKAPAHYVDMTVEVAGQTPGNWLGMAEVYLRNYALPPIGIPLLYAGSALAELRR